MIDGIKTKTHMYYQTNQPTPKVTNKPTLKDTIIYQKEWMTQDREDNQYEDVFKKATSQSSWESFSHKVEIKEEDVAKLHKQGVEVEEIELQQFNYTQTYLSQEMYRGAGATEKDHRLDQKIDRLKEHHDSMYRDAMNQRTLSINSLYESSFKGSKKQGTFTKEDATHLLSLNQIEPTEANTKATMRLLQIGADVSKTNVLKVQNIEAAVETLDKQEEAIKASEDIKNGQEAGNSPLMEEEKILYTDKSIQDIVDELTQVDEDTVTGVVEEGKDVTIGNLRERMLKNTEKVLKKDMKVTEGIKEGEAHTPGEAEVDETEVEAIKEQIKNIRAMLTAESATKLSEKMPLESSKLHEVVAELQTIKATKIEDVAKKVDLPLTKENKEQLGKIMDATTLINRYKDEAVTLVSEGEPGLEAIHKALLAYEEGGTVAEKRFGDTISKLEEEISKFIEANYLPQDKLTTEGVRALILNGMTIDGHQLEQVKQGLLKINTFTEGFTPEYAATWIKEGLSPYKASIEQMLSWLEEQELPKMKQTIASSIIALEDKGKINETQKQTLVGLYRIIGGVQKHKEEVAGYLFKNNLDLTIEKLDEALKYIGKNKVIEKVIDNNFGELEELQYSRQTARQTLEEGQKASQEVLEVAKKVEHMVLQLEGINDDDGQKVSRMLYPFLKEVMKKELGDFKAMDTLPTSTLEKLETMKQLESEVVKTMEKHHIPMTLSNLHWVQKLYDKPQLFGEVLKHYEKVDENLPESLEAFEEKLQALEEEASSKKESLMQQGDLHGYKSYKQLEEMIGVQRQLVEKEGLYQIPFMIEGKMKMVHLYMKEKSSKQSQADDGIRAVMSYDTESLGNVKAYIHLKGEKVSYQVLGESTDATKKLEHASGQLRGILEQLGYEPRQSDFMSQKGSADKPVTMALKGDSQFEMMV